MKILAKQEDLKLKKYVHVTEFCMSLYAIISLIFYCIQVVNLKGSCIELLEAMLEETNDCSKELVGEIQNAIQIEALHDTMVELYELMNDPGVKAAGQNDEAEAALFRTYHVLVHLTDYGVPLDKVGELSNNYVEYTMNHLTCTVSSCMHACILLYNMLYAEL